MFFSFEPRYITAAAILAGSLLLGTGVEWILRAFLERRFPGARWEAGRRILKSLEGMPIFWLFLAGAGSAVQILPITEPFLHYVENLLIVLAIFSVTIAVSRLSVKFVRQHTSIAGATLSSTSIFVNITRGIVFVTGTLVALQTLNISVTPILTTLGVGGLAVALALQDTLANLFAGIQILASRKVSPGDYVKLDTGEEGYVSDISWRNTAIRALQNNLIVVPNSKLAGTIVTNYCMPSKDLAVLVEVGVDYQSDLNHVEQVTVEAARETLQSVSGAVKDFEPFVRYHTFGESGIKFAVILRAQEFSDSFLIKHDFIKRLHERYKKEAITIPSLVRAAYLSSGQSQS